MTTPVISQPDAEAWVWEQIGKVHGVTMFSYAAEQRFWHGWIYAHFLQVDARAKTKKAARDLAEKVRQIMTSLPDQPWAEGSLCYVQPVEGPFWLPGDDGAPRYTARYEIRVHPRRDAAAPPIGADAAHGTAGEEPQ